MPVLIYTNTITPRLQYIAEFTGKELTGKPFELTTDKKLFLDHTDAKLNYSQEQMADNEFWIQPHSLLFENTIKEQVTACFTTSGYKAFFATKGNIDFDIFAACFYLLSRYEEYLPHTKDMYGRYAHQHSIAFKEDFLNQPLINIWLKQFGDKLVEKFPGLQLRKNVFSFLPTYDIDIAWSYRHKGFWRNAGGMLLSLLKGNLSQLKERVQVLRSKQKDPYDAYGWMNRLHEVYKLKPYYFFLLAGKRSKYDKNISPAKKAMQELVRDHLTRYPVGIHPSWQSGDDEKIVKSEIAALSAITGNAVVSSRQHYIRFTLPDTFDKLINSGIRFDFSMGYGSINGFRASVASSFYWYNLAQEKQTELLLFPFCFMEANSFYEQGFTPQQAAAEMQHYYDAVKNINGMLVMIWHNNFLGTDKLYTGWKEVYETFVKSTVPVTV